MRIILCFVLALVAAPTWAEWVEVSETDSVVFYIDPATIRKDGNLRKVWLIQDMKQRHKDGEMSRRARYEFDCKEERVRIVALSGHSESIARGETLWSFDQTADDWSAIPPGTAHEAILELVCAK
jgi:hypothetical protein